MSTIRLTFNVPSTAPYPFNYGKVTVSFNDGSTNLSLFENASPNKSNSTYFQYVGNQSGDDARIAANFATSFNRDYRNVGGNGNIYATVSGKVVTITANNGTFNSASYNGNMMTVSNVIENVEPIPSLAALVSYTNNGNCSTIDWDAVAAEGVPPYKITYNGATVIENWNGNNFQFPVNRGGLATIVISDEANQTKKFTTTVARNLKIGEFKERFTQYDGYSDIEIEETNPVAFTTPIEYSLTDLGESTGLDYQESNSFSGVLPGQYLLWVKDKYGCEVNKTIEVRELEQNGSNEQINRFFVPEGNSLIFSDDVQYGGNVRKNYFNTTTREENTIGKRHQITQKFFEGHEIATRFMSSYPFHVVTLWNCDRTKKDISVATVQTNLGSKEKVDCKLFNVTDGIGVYFDGGNEYEPNTTTIINSSDYNGGTPDWAVIGQLITIDGLGAKYITGEGFDENRGYYFTVEGITTDDLESKVQTTFNKHEYNLFDFFLYMTDITKTGYIRIEYGYDFDNIVGAVKSEVIEKVSDDEKYHFIKWGDSKNKGDMVYQSFPQPFVLLEGKMDNIYPNESETSRGDSKSYSLDQESFLNFSFKTTGISRKMANKLNIAAGTEYFEINNVPLLKSATSSIESVGSTNLKSWYCEFEYSGDQLGIQQDELDILDISTGVVGGGDSAKNGEIPLGDAIVYDGRTRYVDASGNFIFIDGDFVTP